MKDSSDENPYNNQKDSLDMNVRTLRKTLDDYGFETERVLDCLVNVYIKQNVSDKGVLAQDISPFTGVLLGYKLLEKHSWHGVTLFKCTAKSERIAQELLYSKIEPVFIEFKKVNLEGSYFILKYLLYTVNQGKNKPLERLELRLLSHLPVIQELQSIMSSLLLEYGILMHAHQVTGSGPGKEIHVTVPDLYTYFEPYYIKEERILAFEQVLTAQSRRLILFRLLYTYEQRAERIYLRRIKEYRFSLQEIKDILDLMELSHIISYSYGNPFLFRIEDKEGYQTFLKNKVLLKIFSDFSRHLQGIHTNPQAYAVLSKFEDEFRTFLEEALRHAPKNWEERIPKDVLERLKERRNDARIRRKTTYSLLHYIDFPNYLSIILYRTDSFSNWDIFEPYFVSIGWIKGRLIEMNEIRNDLAHPKPLEPLQYRKLQLYIDEIRERIKHHAES
jgi:DNA-binding transcriptional MerR regulator